MKIVLTSDLHCDAAKLLWLLSEAPEHDALLVAGDHLDIFSNAGLTEQKSTVLLWREDVVRSGKSFAWCSGNHDFFHGESSPMKSGSPLWMKETPSTRHCITDGESRLLEVGAERCAVTTIPWAVTGDTILIDGYRTNYLDFIKRLLHAGRKLKDEERVPWIVLSHEPPCGTPLSATYEAPDANFAHKTIVAAEPDFSLHGHVHQAPTHKNGLWIWQTGKTVCFNAGQSEPGKPPHFILLDWRDASDWTTIWRGSGKEHRVTSAAYGGL